MNVQRLIEKYKNLEGIWNAEGAELARQIFIEDLKQLDEQKPVKVPQFVAEYIEFQKKNNFHVYGAMRIIEDHYDKRVPEWFYEGNIEKILSCLDFRLRGRGREAVYGGDEIDKTTAIL